MARKAVLRKGLMTRMKKVLGVSDLRCDKCRRLLKDGEKVYHSRQLPRKDRYGNIENRESFWFRCKSCYEKGFIDP